MIRNIARLKFLSKYSLVCPLQVKFNFSSIPPDAASAATNIAANAAQTAGATAGDALNKIG